MNRPLLDGQQSIFFRRAAHSLLRSFFNLYLPIVWALATSYTFTQIQFFSFFIACHRSSNFSLFLVSNITNSTPLLPQPLSSLIIDKLCYLFLGTLVPGHRPITSLPAPTVVSSSPDNHCTLSVNKLPEICFTPHHLLALLYFSVCYVMGRNSSRVRLLYAFGCTEPVVSQRGSHFKALQELLNRWFAALNTIKNSTKILIHKWEEHKEKFCALCMLFGHQHIQYQPLPLQMFDMNTPTDCLESENILKRNPKGLEMSDPPSPATIEPQLQASIMIVDHSSPRAKSLLKFLQPFLPV